MYSKPQRLFMVGYIAFAVVMLLFLHSGVNRHTTYPFDAVIGAPVPFSFGVFAIQNGWVNTRYSRIDRDESPVSYWFYVALALSLGAGLFFWGIVNAIRTMH